jgi:hypothetical protein
MTNKEHLVKIATEEWNYFGNQEISFRIKDGKQETYTVKYGHKETESPYYQRVARYWNDALGLSYTGKDAIPWSAAFISYLMKESKLTKTDFLFNAQHAKYIRKAIIAKQANDNGYGFWGYRLTEYQPEVGDLVCYVREGAVGKINYDSTSNDYDSHSDLVVEKNGNTLKVIGGNVADSVTMKHLLLDDNGYLADKTKNWFVILKNNKTELATEDEIQEQSSQKFVVTGDGVRLRSYPTKEDEQNVITSLNKGDLVDYYQASDDKLWSKVKFNDKTGWIYSLYLKPAITPAVNNNKLTPAADNYLNDILDIVSMSTIINYNWKDRGKAPLGYYQGMALMFGRLYCRLKNGDTIAKEIAKPATGNPKKDSLTYYDDIFESFGMDNEIAGADTLRHLFILMVGLGLRESSGRHCVGRDTTANNIDGERAEAGLFQTSYNARNLSPLLPVIFTNYKNNPDGFIEVFSKGVTCGANNWDNFGEGDGKEFQKLSKECPGFAVEFTAVAMRNTSGHWGPIINRKTEIKPECNVMFLKVQNYIDQNNIPAL